MQETVTPAQETAAGMCNVKRKKKNRVCLLCNTAVCLLNIVCIGTNTSKWCDLHSILVPFSLHQLCILAEHLNATL